MAKRFTTTEKFNDPWYRKLSPVQKCLWEYALCQCDFAGFWNVDLEAAAFHIGTDKITDKDLEAFQDRFVWLSAELIFIPKFIYFQYGELNKDNKAHQGVIKRLQQNNISLERGYVAPAKGLDRGYLAPQDIYKEKEKEKELKGDCQGGNEKSKKGCRFENSAFFGENVPETFVLEAQKMNKSAIAQAEYDRFRDYWTAKTGQSATKLDWLATWRNWLRDTKGGGSLPTGNDLSPVAPDAGRHHSREEMEAFLGRKMEIFDTERKWT